MWDHYGDLLVDPDLDLDLFQHQVTIRRTSGECGITTGDLLVDPDLDLDLQVSVGSLLDALTRGSYHLPYLSSQYAQCAIV